MHEIPKEVLIYYLNEAYFGTNFIASGVLVNKDKYRVIQNLRPP